MPESNRALALSADQLEQLEQWLAAHGTPQQVALRCRIVLAAVQGGSDLSIAAGLDVNRHTVTLWRKRFAEQGLECLWQIAAGRGRKPIFGIEQIKAVVDATLQTKPKGMTHWSCRLMAKRQGMSKSTISNIWRSHNLKPHRVKTFKLSRDPKFVEKLTDVIGLYLNPPEHALVLCVDEKSQIQALDRTQPGLPLKKGRCGTMTHDYKRNGTTTLFAALELLEGKVIGQCYQRHRHQEFLRFLRHLDREFPATRSLHLVIDDFDALKRPTCDAVNWPTPGVPSILLMRQEVRDGEESEGGAIRTDTEGIRVRGGDSARGRAQVGSSPPDGATSTGECPAARA